MKKKHGIDFEIKSKTELDYFELISIKFSWKNKVVEKKLIRFLSWKNKKMMKTFISILSIEI